MSQMPTEEGEPTSVLVVDLLMSLSRRQVNGYETTEPWPHRVRMSKKWPTEKVKQPRNLCFNATLAYIQDKEPMSVNLLTTQTINRTHVHTLVILYILYL